MRATGLNARLIASFALALAACAEDRPRDLPGYGVSPHAAHERLQTWDLQRVTACFGPAKSSDIIGGRPRWRYEREDCKVGFTFEGDAVLGAEIMYGAEQACWKVSEECASGANLAPVPPAAIVPQRPATARPTGLSIKERINASQWHGPNDPSPWTPAGQHVPGIDLAALEDCSNTELTSYFGKVGGYRFHRDGCWADVVFTEHGDIARFTPDDKKLCETVIRQCAR